MFAAVSRLVTYPFRTIRAPSLYGDVLNGFIRCMLTRMTIPQARLLQPSTTELYLARCQKLKIKPKTIEVDTQDGKVKAHWVGDPNAKAVFIYFHGGGFTQPANEGQFQNIERLIKVTQDNEKARSVAFLFVAYSLAPEATYPTQLREAAAILRYLLEAGRDASDIFISGDSSGGGIAIALLSHILHPRPGIPTIKYQGKFGGLLAYSPWVGFRTDYPSYRDNANLDMLPALGLRRWSAMLLGKTNPANAEADPGDVSGDAWIEACLNPASWWHGLPDVISSIHVSYGGSEVFKSPIVELGTQMKQGWTESAGEATRVSFYEGVNEAHIAPIVNLMAPGGPKASYSQISIEYWFTASLCGAYRTRNGQFN